MATQTTGGAPDRSILRRKPILTEAELHADGEGLDRSIGLWGLTAIGVGAIIGAGIFTLTGAVAKDIAGPGVAISFLIAGVASACAALSYAEFGGLIPQAGSAYTYGYSTLGEFIAWFIGWDLLLEYTAIVAVVAISVSGYFSFLTEAIGISLPNWMLGAPSTGDGRIVDLPAVVLCLLVAFMLNRGIKSSTRIETILVFVKVAIVIAVIVVGAKYFDKGNLQPYLPYGFGGTVTGAATVFFAVFGYDAMSTAAEESKDAQRILPKAIILSLAISMVLYLLASTVITGMIPYKELDETDAFAAAFKAVGLPGFANVVAIGAIVGITTVLFSFMLGASRVWYAIARDGLLPAWFTKTNQNQSPYRPTWIVGILSALLAGFTPILDAAKLTNIGILAAFIVVSIAVIVLRYRSPELERTFKVPLMPVLPIVGIGFSIWLITELTVDTFIRFGVWMLIGVIIYATYGYKHSVVGKGGVVHTKDA